MPDLASVRVIFVEQVTRSGTPIANGGVQTNPSDEVAVVGQDDPAENGIYVIPALGALGEPPGAWTLRADFAIAGNLEQGTDFLVREGDVFHRNSRWQLVTEDFPITFGTTPILFSCYSREKTLDAGVGIVVGEDLTVELEAVVPLANRGRATFATTTNDEYGRLIDNEPNEIFSTFIEGLGVEKVSSTSVRIREGAAWAPGLGRPIDLPLDLTLSGLILAANSTYYLYLHENQGAGTVEVSSEAYTAPYRGSARTKGGTTPDDTRRFIGRVLTTTGGAISRVHGEVDVALSDPQALRFVGSVTTGTTVAIAGSAFTTQLNWAKIPYNTQQRNSGIGVFDATLRRFTPNRAGEYTVIAFIDLESGTLGTDHLYRAAVYKNGALEKQFDSDQAAIGTRGLSLSGSTPVICDGVNDYLEVMLATTNNSAPSTNSASWLSITYSGTV